MKFITHGPHWTINGVLSQSYRPTCYIHWHHARVSVPPTRTNGIGFSTATHRHVMRQASIGGNLLMQPNLPQTSELLDAAAQALCDVNLGLFQRRLVAIKFLPPAESEGTPSYRLRKSPPVCPHFYEIPFKACQSVKHVNM